MWLIFAGATVVIAMLGLLALGVSLLYGAALAASLGVPFVLAASITLLPALLKLTGTRLGRTRSTRRSSEPELRKGFCHPLGRTHPAPSPPPGAYVPCGFQNAVHAAAQWYSWISPPRRSRRLISPAVGRGSVFVESGVSKREAAMWAVAVVVGFLDAEYRLEVAAAEDQQPIETFRADGGRSVRRRRLLAARGSACGSQ